MTITKQEFLEKFTYLRDGYCIENATGKTFAYVVLDNPPDCVEIIEPQELEKNIKKIEKGLEDFFEKLKKEMGEFLPPEEWKEKD